MAKKILLKGRVQGVGCRGYCSLYARVYGLKGSATNLSDGSVRLIIDSDDEKIVGLYVNALITNPERHRFYGRITDIDVSDYAGRVYGDYMF